MTEEYAVIFDGGAWCVMRKGDGVCIAFCPTLEAAIMEISFITGAPVVLPVLTRQP